VSSKTGKAPDWLLGVSFIRGPILFVIGFALALFGELLFLEFNPNVAITIGWIGWFIEAVGLIDFLICVFTRIFGSAKSS
jgi:hypothetical protein